MQKSRSGLISPQPPYDKIESEGLRINFKPELNDAELSKSPVQIK